MKKIIIFSLIILLDSASKYWAHISMPNISVIGDWISIVLYKNTGIAFSTPLPGIYIIIPLILLGLLGYIISSWKQLSEAEKIGYLLILTGGSLNAIERSIMGSVTDMISVKYFAVFNVADMSVTLGVMLLLIINILSSRHREKIFAK